MTTTHHLASIYDYRVSDFKNQRFRRLAIHQIFQASLQAQSLSGDSISAGVALLLQQGPQRAQLHILLFLVLSQLLIQVGAHRLRSLIQGIDALLLPLLQALECALARFFIHVGDDVLRKVEDTVKIALADIKKDAQMTGNPTGIPDVRNRRRQHDMPHPFSTYRRAGDLNAAFITDDAAVSNTLVLTTIALIIATWSKNRFTKQAIFFRS
ncbi:MAG: hypothetical protein BWY63_00303 [Chloroflexi bacterium ADurb.Bin360]|nr:MAG: hypothetical protein BWY63_00303 [Chloroflexi bacterium ADurb.Bin360]